MLDKMLIPQLVQVELAPEQAVVHLAQDADFAA
jgi:hypothetical protein